MSMKKRVMIVAALVSLGAPAVVRAATSDEGMNSSQDNDQGGYYQQYHEYDRWVVAARDEGRDSERDPGAAERSTGEWRGSRFDDWQ